MKKPIVIYQYGGKNVYKYKIYKAFVRWKLEIWVNSVLQQTNYYYSLESLWSDLGYYIIPQVENYFN